MIWKKHMTLHGNTVIDNNIKSTFQMLYIPLVLPKLLWCIGAWPQQDLWTCPVVSSTKTLAADPLISAGCVVGPPWMGFVGPAHPTIAQSDWDLGNSEAKAIPWTLRPVPETIPQLFLHCCRVYYSAEGGHCHQRTLLPRRGVRCSCAHCRLFVGVIMGL